MDGLPKTYVPAEHEGAAWRAWEAGSAFHADPARVLRGEARPYAIVIPPPNVTDRLHVGHALNNTLQDILARLHRMMGFETLWMPGTDHAGIATQAVVERRILKDEGRHRKDFTRAEFIARIQAFKDEYEAAITGQLKALGCSCDWDRQRFTMDRVCAAAVREAFFRLFKDGLIYRGKRLVNWDPILQTAVADDEVEDIEVEAHFYYLRYPVMHPWDNDAEPTPVTWSELEARGFPVPPGDEFGDDKPAWVTVATTRPETYLGDTAVAVNPRDPRAGALRGLCVDLPLVGRAIPIIEDDYVVLPASMQDDPESAASDPKAQFATGFLKVTPAHDPNDWEIGRRHKLRVVNIFAPDASISDRHGWDDVGDAHIFVGLPREAARKKVVEEFYARGLVEAIKPYRHTVGHSDRSKAAIEPYLSDQWYVRVTDDRLRTAALDAMAPAQRSVNPDRTGGARNEAPPANADGDGSLRFHPERYARTFESWHENIRDWCISRQLWWGHRIPVWSSPTEWHQPSDGVREQRRYGEVFAYLAPLRDRGRVFTHFFGVRSGSIETSNRPGEGTHTVFSADVNPQDYAGFFVCILDPEGADHDAVKFLEARGFSQDPDVLDTWFSSALWPMSTMGWPEPTDLLRAFNPTDTLCTAREIITLWVSRMVMFNRYFMPEGWPGPAPRHAALSTRHSGSGRGPVPFRDVFIHAMIQDGDGRKMSKSLGNGVDPLDIIASHGTDALRFTLCHMTTHTQDVRLPVERDAATGRNTSTKFDMGRNFCNKLWNAARFSLGILSPGNPVSPGSPGCHGSSGSDASRASPTPPSETPRSLVDRWMLSRIESGVRDATAALEQFRFSEYAQSMYTLLWNDFCDWYLEAIKPTVGASPTQRAVLAHSLETIVRILHPVAPFITEAIWQRLREVETAPIPGILLEPARKGGLLATAGWPRVAPSLRDPEAERQFDRVRALVAAIREVRAQHQVAPRRRVTLHAGPGAVSALIADAGGLVETLAGLAPVAGAAPPRGAAVPFRFEESEVHLSDLADEVDESVKRERDAKQIAELEKSIRTLEGRLANPGYAERAPPAMVQETRNTLAKAKSDLARLRGDAP